MNLLKLLCKEKDGTLNVDFDDTVIRGVTVVKTGEVTWPAPPIQVSAQPKAKAAEPVAAKEPEKPASPYRKYVILAVAIILFGWLANVAPKNSFLTLLSLRSLAWSGITWYGTSAMRCIHR